MEVYYSSQVHLEIPDFYEPVNTKFLIKISKESLSNPKEA
jgi:hypothetical protein